MKIIGIDPGLQSTGFGIIEVQDHQMNLVSCGTVRTSGLKGLPPKGDLPARIKLIFRDLTQLIEMHQPHAASIEIVFVNKNPQSSLLLGQARGAALAALTHADIPVWEYTALQMKKAMTGHGHAQKDQIQEMVKRILGLPKPAGPDASDALGLAITHAHASKSLALIASATHTQRRQHAVISAGRVL